MSEQLTSQRRPEEPETYIEDIDKAHYLAYIEKRHGMDAYTANTQLARIALANISGDEKVNFSTIRELAEDKLNKTDSNKAAYDMLAAATAEKAYNDAEGDTLDKQIAAVEALTEEALQLKVEATKQSDAAERDYDRVQLAKSNFANAFDDKRTK